jgi:hypothetical protein
MKMTNTSVFFEAGKVYTVYLKTGGVRKFVCTGSDKENLIVRGSYEGGKEKGYRAIPAWNRLIDKQEGLSPVSYTIKINDRNGLFCSSEDYEKLT